MAEVNQHFLDVCAAGNVAAARELMATSSAHVKITERVHSGSWRVRIHDPPSEAEMWSRLGRESSGDLDCASVRGSRRRGPWPSDGKGR